MCDLLSEVNPPHPPPQPRARKGGSRSVRGFLGAALVGFLGFWPQSRSGELSAFLSYYREEIICLAVQASENNRLHIWKGFLFIYLFFYFRSG